jgi:hypothetical protein
MKLMGFDEIVNRYVTLDMEHLVKQKWIQDWRDQNWGLRNSADLTKLLPMKHPHVYVQPNNIKGWMMMSFVAAINDNSQIRQIVCKIPAGTMVKGTYFKVTPDIAFRDVMTGIGYSGWDPEIFVEDGANNLLPAFTFLPPKDKGILHGAGRVYYDGFQAEFTTNPIGCHGHGFDYLRLGLKGVLTAARKKALKAILSVKSVYRIPDSLMISASDDQVALGCKPSQNVYGTLPYHNEASRTLPYRVSGGHIHFSIGNAPLEESQIINRIKGMDLFLALPSVGIFADVDDPLRREFYGRAGEYRTPKYGLEYRTLSSAWLCSPKLGHGIMDVARRACGAGSKGDVYELTGIKSEAVVEAINYCDVKSARKLTEKLWPSFMRVMEAPWYKEPRFERAYKQLVHEGVAAGFPNYDKIETNWKLDGVWVPHSDDSRATFNAHCTQSQYRNA